MAEQLIEKNISIDSFTKELLKLRRNAEFSERKYEELIAKMKLDYEDQLREKDREFAKIESYHKEDIIQLKQT